MKSQRLSVVALNQATEQALREQQIKRRDYWDGVSKQRLDSLQEQVEKAAATGKFEYVVHVTREPKHWWYDMPARAREVGSSTYFEWTMMNKLVDHINTMGLKATLQSRKDYDKTEWSVVVSWKK